MSELLVEHSIRSLHEAFKSGQLTPMDVAESCIAQYERLEKTCCAWVRFDPEQLRNQSQAATARIARGETLRQLEGIPIGVKDIFNSADYPTQMGSPLWKDFTPGNDARAVFHLTRQGALLPGKTVTAEFAVHTLGETINPHAAELTPGTSSSGSAAAVATAMVPAALGTQTAGSIVRPASFCGVYGCKPSFGLIPRMGMLKTTDSLDTVGYFTLHREDLERLFDCLRVHGQNYPLSDKALRSDLEELSQGVKVWKIAYVRPGVFRDADPVAIEALDRWAAQLSQLSSVEVTVLESPAELERAHQIHETIYNKSLSYYFKGEHQRAELVSPTMNHLIELGLKTSPAAYREALKQQEHFAREVDDMLAPFDAACTLSTAGVAPLRETTEAPDSALIWTLSHLPVVSAPAFASKTGLPFGLQFLSRRYRDYRLFRFMDFLAEHDLLPNRAFPVATCLLEVTSRQ